jgi:RNA polymerase sigma factor (sigma-70 family)
MVVHYLFIDSTGRMPMKKPSSSKKRRPYLVAMVLGTALAALGTAESSAEVISSQAISSISRYCTACWRNARLPPDLWGDCTQEVLCRLLERVPAAGWDQVLTGDSEERREFLRAIDAVKKRRQRERARSSNLNEVVADCKDQLQRSEQEDREVVRQAANEVLTARQQRILQLTCEGYGVAEIAGQLSLTPERVSDEKYKAVQKLRGYFRCHPELRG